MAVLAMAGTGMAGVGDSWILPVDHLDGSFNTIAGAGYNGTDAYEGLGFDGVRRVWWSMGNQAGMPTAQKELFSVEWYVPTSGTINTYNPIESANVGESEGVMNAVIPWDGQFGTNHQWLSNNDGVANANRGSFLQAGPGPQAPESDDYYAGGNGLYMWLDGNASLYAKWNFGWYTSTTGTTYSVLRITQVTPEPTSLLLLLLGAPLVRRRTR